MKNKHVLQVMQWDKLQTEQAEDQLPAQMTSGYSFSDSCQTLHLNQLLLL